jgi:AcrR family transcriptional regulator
MKSTRSYSMGARAQAVEETRRRILEATFALAAGRVISAISLGDVATGAGVSVQTVIRQFGSRAGLLEATTAYALEQVTGEREAPVGDIDAALVVLVDHYELRGDASVLMLAQERIDEQAAVITHSGKALHRRWVRTVFAPYLQGAAMLDLLVVATDVYTWKLLRRDRALSRARTEKLMKTLVTAVLVAPTTKEH